MNAGRTARDRARAELTREIKDAARRQLATEGAERLSLRAVSRELGMVSSALYRYFPSRDDLLTALIIDAYDALGAEAEAAAKARATDPRTAWLAVCRAVRDLGGRASARVRADLRLTCRRVQGTTDAQSSRRAGSRSCCSGYSAARRTAGVLAPPADAPEPVRRYWLSRLAVLAELAHRSTGRRC